MQLYQRKDRLWISRPNPHSVAIPNFGMTALQPETFDCTGNAIAQMDEPDVSSVPECRRSPARSK